MSEQRLQVPKVLQFEQGDSQVKHFLNIESKYSEIEQFHKQVLEKVDPQMFENEETSSIELCQIVTR
jgi:hypothetical protein